ncbi:tetratricopeptide repeat protein [Candidatus Uabimicrobium sp. HlEnr_7]|uniref:protein kinase domain-containing protein n=1 Tax=Candidatus Uabimicrobium helgolandensis TaxID=3095367 RepID=UPI003558EAD0
MRVQDNLFIKLALHMKMITKEQVLECQLEKDQSASRTFCKKGYICTGNLQKLEEHVKCRTLKNRYVVFGEIGRGGMGAIYKAFDLFLNKEIALKNLQRSGTEDIERFVREVRTIAKLHHPNIIKMYDVIEEDNQYFFSMDFIEGQTFADAIKENFSQQQIIEILIKIGDAVHYAHRQGIIHRDLKPENVMLNSELQPIVMDFGLAKEVKNLEKLSASGAIIGTPSYMSPEQANANNDNVDERSDVYALGVILYEALTKKLPFTAPRIAILLVNICTKDPQIPSRLDSSVPSELDRICLKALEKDQDKRYQSAADFVDDLLRFQQGKTIRAHMPRKWTRIIRKIKRDAVVRTSLFAVIITTVVSVFGIALFGSWQNSHQMKLVFTKATNMFDNTSDYKTLQKLQKVSKAKAYRAAEHSLFKYRETLSILEQITYPNDQTENLRFIVEKQMGLVALLTKNYILSELCFQRCKKIYPEKSKILFTLLKSKREEVKKAAIKQLEEIMGKVNDKLTLYVQDDYVTTIIKQPEDYIVQELLYHVTKTNASFSQKKIAIEALGKIGKREVLYEKKDVVQWLMFILQQATKNREEDLAEVTIWALGRLRDARSNVTVYRARIAFGQGSSLFLRTEIPYRWIPVSRIKDTSAESVFLRASAKIEKKDYKGAIADLTARIKLQPHPDLLSTRADTYEKLQQFDKSIADYSYILKYFKTTKVFASDIYSKRAIALSQQGKYNEALSDFKQAISLNPQYPLHYNNRGFLYLSCEKIDLALKDFDEAIRRNRNNFHALCNRAYVYNKKSMWHKAIADLTVAIQINPQRGETYLDRGYSYEKIGKINQAIDDYKQALKENPSIREAYSNLGYIYYRKGDIQKAFKLYNKALSIDRNFGSPYYFIARYYHDKKMWKEAEKNYSFALQIETFAHPDLAYKERAQVYIKLKRYDLAIRDWKQYLRKYPDNVDRDKIVKYIKKYSRK